MPWVAYSDPDMPNYCTPANVGDTLRELGYQVYARGAAGWRTLWAGGDAVKVDHPAAALPELHTAAELLRAAGWAAAVQDDGWVRVTGTRGAGRAACTQPHPPGTHASCPPGAPCHGGPG